VTDAGQIALLDLGMVGRIAPRLQEPLLQLLLAISEGQSDDAVGFALRWARSGRTSTSRSSPAESPIW
jgi:ubiquinone biosynthesis protein